MADNALGIPSLHDMMNEDPAKKAARLARRAELMKMLETPEEAPVPGVWDSAKAGLFDITGAGLSGLGDMVGSKGVEDVGGTFSKWARDLAPEGPKSTLGEIAYYGAGMLPIMAGAAAGGMGAAGLAGLAGATEAAVGTAGTLGALGGASAIDYPIQYGGNIEEQKKANNGVIQDRGAAALAAIPQTIMDSLLEGFAAFKLFGLGTKAAIKAGDKLPGLLTKVVKDAATGAVIEVPTEIGQQVLQRIQAGEDPTSEDAMNEYATIARVSATMGGLAGGMAGTFEHFQNSDQLRKLNAEKADKDKKEALNKSLADRIAAMEAKQTEEKGKVDKADGAAQPKLLGYDPSQYDDLSPGQVNRNRYPLSPEMAAGVHEGPTWNIKDLGDIGEKINYNRAAMGLDPTDKATVLDLRSLTNQDRERAFAIINGVGPAGKPVENKPYTQKHRDDLIKHMRAAGKEMTLDEITRAARINKIAEVGDTVDVTDDQGRKIEVTEPQKVTGLVETASGTHVILNNVKNRPIPLKNAIPTAPTVSESSPTAVDNPLVPNQPAAEPFTPESDAQRKAMAKKVLQSNTPAVITPLRDVAAEKQATAEKKTNEHAARQWAAAQILDSLRKSNAALNETKTNQNADATAKASMRAVESIQKKTVEELKKVFLGNAQKEYLDVYKNVIRHMERTGKTPSQIQYTDVYANTGVEGRDAQTMTPTRGARKPNPQAPEQAPPLKPEDVEYEALLFTKASDEWTPVVGNDTTITQKGQDGWRIVRKRAADGEFDYAVDSEVVPDEFRKELGKRVYDTELEAAQALVQFKDTFSREPKSNTIPYAKKIAPVPLRPTTGMATPSTTTTKVAESPLAPVSQVEAAKPMTEEEKKQQVIESRAQSFLNSTKWKPYSRLVGGVQQLVGNERLLDGWRIVRIRDLKSGTEKYGIDFNGAPEALRNKMRAGVYATEKEAAIALVKAKEFYTAAKTQNQADQKVATKPPAPAIVNQMPAAPTMTAAAPVVQPAATPAPAQPVGQFQSAAMNLKNNIEAITKFGSSLPTIAKQIVKDFKYRKDGVKWSGYVLPDGTKILHRMVTPKDKEQPAYATYRVDFSRGQVPKKGQKGMYAEFTGKALGGNDGAKIRALDWAMQIINNPPATTAQVSMAEKAAENFKNLAATAKPESETVASSAKPEPKKKSKVVVETPMPDLSSRRAFDTGWSTTVYEDSKGNKKNAFENGPYKIYKLVSDRDGKVYGYQLRKKGKIITGGRKRGVFYTNNDLKGTLDTVQQYAYEDATRNSVELGQQNDIIQPGINPIYQTDLDTLAAKNEKANPPVNQTMVNQPVRSLADRARENAKQYDGLKEEDNAGYEGYDPAEYADYDPNNMNSIGNIDPDILGKTTLEPKLRESILRRLDDFYRDYIHHELLALKSEKLINGDMVATDKVAEQAARATYKKMRDMFYDLYPGKPEKEKRPLFTDWMNSMKKQVGGAEALDAEVSSIVAPSTTDRVPDNATKAIRNETIAEKKKREKEDAEWAAVKGSAPANQYIVSPLVNNVLNRPEPVRKPTPKQRVVVPDNEAATQLINDLIDEGVLIKTENGYKYADQAQRARDILNTVEKSQSRVSNQPSKGAVRSTFEVESLPVDQSIADPDPAKQYALKTEKHAGPQRWLRSGKEGKPLLFPTAKAAREYLERYLNNSDSLYQKELDQYKEDAAKYEAGNWQGDHPKPPVYKWVASKITPVTVSSETTKSKDGKIKTTKQNLVEDNARMHWVVLKTGFDSSGKRVSQVPVSFHKTEQEAKENADNHRWNEREFSISKYDWTSENSAALMRQSAPATDAMAMVMDTVPEGKAEFTPEQAGKIAEEELKDKAFRQPDAYLKKTYGAVFDAVDAAIKEAHAKMGLGKMGIKVGLYGNVNKNVEGLYSAKRKLIALSMSAHIDPKLSTADNVRRVVSTFTHEAFHAFEDLGIITSEEFDILTNDVKTRKPPGGKYTFMQMARMNKSYQAQFNPDNMIQNPDTMARATKNISNRGQKVDSKSLADEIMRLSDDGFRGEAIANYAAYWARNDLNATPKAKSIFGKIIDFVMKIFKSTRDNGVNGEAIFSDMTSGNFAKRTPKVNQLDGVRFSLNSNRDHSIVVNRVEPSTGGEHERAVSFSVLNSAGEEALSGFGKFTDEFMVGPLGELGKDSVFYIDKMNTNSSSDKAKYNKIAAATIGAFNDSMISTKVLGKNDLDIQIGTPVKPEEAVEDADTEDLYNAPESAPDETSDSESFYEPNGQFSAENILQNDYDYGANLDLEMPEISNFSDSIGNRVKFGGSHLHQMMTDRERAYGKVLETFQWFARKMTPQIVKKVLGFTSTDINNWAQRVYMAAADKDIPIGKLVDMARKAGGYIDETMDPFLQAELKSDEIIPEIERVRREYVDPLLRYMAENDLDVHRVNDYLYARHAPERNELGRKRNAKRIEKMLKEGEAPTEDMMNASGITDEGAAIVMRALQSEGYVRIGVDGKPVSGRLYEVGQLFDRLTRETTRIRVEHGLLPGMDELLNGKNATNFEFYAPLFSNELIMGEEFLDTSTMARTAGKYTIKGLESKHITGRHTKAGMIIESAILQNHESIIRGKRANVGQALNNLYESDPSLFQPIMRKVDAPPLRKVLTADGYVMQMVDNNYKTMPQYFVTKVDGKEVVFEFSVDSNTNQMTPQAAMLSRALRGFNKTQDVNGFVKVLQGLNHFLTKANTAWNPEFTITNLIRDLGLAMFNVEQHQLPGIRKDIMSNWKGAYNSVYRYDPRAEIEEAYMRVNPVTGTFNKDPKEWTMDETVHAFRRLGGMTQYYGKLDMKAVMNDLQQTMTTLEGKDSKPHMVMGAMKKAVGFVEHWNTAVEQAIRIATFKAMIDRGVSPVKATSAAKNLTVNFNKGGEQKILLNAMYLFYNASIRGSITLMDAMLHSKKLRKYAVGITAMGFLADQLAAAMSDEDKDGTLAWDNLKQWKKESAINIPIGGGQYFSIPLPWGLSFFWNNGRAASDAMRTGNVGRNVGSMMSGMVSNFSPIGSVENVANFFAPTILDPIIAVNSNSNWDSAPIQPENLPFGPQKPNSQLYWNSTSATMKDTAAALNSITGGDENLAGWGDISPNILEYWSNFMLGGTGMFVLRTKDFMTDALPRILSGEDYDFNEIPFARKVLAGTGIRTAQEKYQENLKNATTYKGALQHAAERGNADQVTDYANRFGKEISMAPALTKMNSARSDLRKTMDIVDNSQIPDSYKASIDRVLNAARNDVVWDSNRMYNTVVNGGKK